MRIVIHALTRNAGLDHAQLVRQARSMKRKILDDVRNERIWFFDLPKVDAKAELDHPLVDSEFIPQLENLILGPSHFFALNAAYVLYSLREKSDYSNVLRRLLTGGRGESLRLSAAMTCDLPDGTGQPLLLDRLLNGESTSGCRHLYKRLTGPYGIQHVEAVRKGLGGSSARAAKAAAELANKFPLDAALASELRAFFDQWRTKEEPYPRGGGSVPESPRGELAKILAPAFARDHDFLLDLLADDRPGVQSAAREHALLASYRDERLKAVSPQSVVHELGMVSRIYKVAAMDWGIALPRGNPVALVRKPTLRNERDRRLVGNEEELLSAALRTCKNPYPHAAFVLAVETAARQSELIALTWEDIDLHARVARIRGKNGGVTKNGDTFRDVPLSTRAINTLKALPLPRSGSVLRMSQNSLKLAWQRAVSRARQSHLHERLRQRLTAAGVTAANQEREIRALVFRKRAPSPRTVQLLKDLENSDKTLEDLKFHDLRHEATSRLAERLEMHELMKVTGHKTSRTLMRYYHPRASDLAKKLA